MSARRRKPPYPYPPTVNGPTAVTYCGQLVGVVENSEAAHKLIASALLYESVDDACTYGDWTWRAAAPMDETIEDLRRRVGTPRPTQDQVVNRIGMRKQRLKEDRWLSVISTISWLVTLGHVRGWLGVIACLVLGVCFWMAMVIDKPGTPPWS